MQFKLIDTQQPDETNQEEETSEEDSYEEIHQTKKEPVKSTLEKKRENKTVECPGCHRKMSSKTYKYSHKCPTAKVKEEETPKEIEITKPPEQDPYQLLQEQETQR